MVGSGRPRYDVVVAGAGIGGMCAALSAQQGGANVLVLEKAARIGGSAAASGGGIWCADSLDAWLSVQPGGDTALGAALVDGYREGIPWLRELGVALEPADGSGYKFSRVVHQFTPDARTALDTMAGLVEAAGGAIATRSALADIVTEDGKVAAAVVRGDGGERVVATGAVIIATGGFQGNPELRARYFGRWSDQVIVRGVRENTGDGLEAAVRAGAATAGPFSRFYGHFLPAPPAEVGLHNFVKVKPDFSEHALVVNLLGERFDDEYLGDEVTVHALVHQPEATGVLVFDEAIRARQGELSQSRGADTDRVRNIRDAGGEVLSGDSLQALAEAMRHRWGVPPDRFLATMERYAAACAAGDGSGLAPPKSGGLLALETAPFYAIRVLPGATFTYGGTRVNANAEVLDRAGEPLPGLYAAGADCGGVYTRGYTGGLCLGLVFGRIAGRQAAAYARPD